MSRRLGPLTFGKKENEIFLGREIATHKDFSEETSVAIDQEIRRIVETAQQQAESIILEHTDKLEILTAELLKREVLAGDEIDRLLNSHPRGGKKQNPNRRRRSSSKPRSNKPSTHPRQQNNPDAPQNDTSKASGSGENVPQNKPQSGGADEKLPEKKNQNTPKAPAENKQADNSQDKKEELLKARRTRMIRMKTGGRRRVIKKAPAQKIRKIK